MAFSSARQSMSTNAPLKLVMIQKSVIIAGLDFNSKDLNSDWCDATWGATASYPLLPVSIVLVSSTPTPEMPQVFFPFSF